MSTHIVCQIRSLHHQGKHQCSMSPDLNQVKVLEECRISPPPNSVPNTAIPLASIDYFWLFCSPVQRVFLYQVPLSVSQFTDEVLPQLRESLSLALQLYFPFCSNFVCPPQPSEPYIAYKDGDSVPLLIVQSDGSFSEFLRNEPRDAKVLHLLVPPSLPTSVLDETLMKLTPLLSVQVTLFPNAGLCVGFTYCHVVADGMSFINFIKTWSSFFKANCDMSGVSVSKPVHDRSVIKDPNGIRDIVLGYWQEDGCPTGNQITACPLEDPVLATFTMSRAEIDRLKKWVSAKCDKGMVTAPYSPFSSFAVTSAFIWACLIKSIDLITPGDDASSEDEKMCHFLIVADIRNKYDSGIPVTYFGNCLALQMVSLRRSTFQQEDCVAKAAEAISYSVQSLKHGVFDGYVPALAKFAEAYEKAEFILTVAGSPRLAAYDTDFGWGRPAKTEFVHFNGTGAISVYESRYEKGGIEVGLCQSRHHMNVFTSCFQAGMNQFV